MALWRDPLDELIADLERGLPPETGRGQWGLPPIEGLQLLVSAILSGTPDAWEQANRDPRARAYLEYSRRFVRPAPAGGGDEDHPPDCPLCDGDRE